MPRDYKHAPRPGQKQAGIPGWAWLLGGLLAGSIAMRGYSLWEDSRRKEPTAAAQQLTQPAATPDKQTGKGKDQPADGKAKFDFYKMLPRFEVVIPDQDREVRSGETAVPVDKPGTYVLQVGSFRNYSDADRLRANLALLGIESSVQKVQVDDGQTWNRVRIGPVSDIKRLNDIRQQLNENHIESLVIRTDDAGK